VQLVNQLYTTLFERIPLLPDRLEIFPAHGAGSLCGKEISQKASSNLGDERQYNPWLKKTDYDKWKKSLLENMPAVPHYFKRMKKMNITGPEPHASSGYTIVRAMQVLKLMPQHTIVDIRSPHSFAEQHIKGSINIPPSPNAAFWAGAVLSGNEQILLVVSSIGDAPAAIETFKLIGMDAVKGIVLASTWKDDSEKILWQKILESTPNADVKTLESKQEEMYILDVRTLAEWNAGHISDAHLVELSQFRDSLGLIPKDKPIAVICHSGNRSSLAASMLRKAGFPSVISIKGGMEAWQKAKGKNSEGSSEG
jgi:hydroxyacylglutathione hydrolase